MSFLNELADWAKIIAEILAIIASGSSAGAACTTVATKYGLSLDEVIEKFNNRNK